MLNICCARDLSHGRKVSSLNLHDQKSDFAFLWFYVMFLGILNGINALLRGWSMAYGLLEKRSFIRLKLISLALLFILTFTVFVSFCSAFS
jgi:uncharacterized BrkB/YihY/UPF0761 family membrane protein